MSRTKVKGIADNAIHNVHLTSGVVHNVNLADDSVDSDVISNNILAQVTDDSPVTSINDPSEYKLGKVIREYSTTGVTVSSGSAADVFTGANHSGFTGGSHLELMYYMPTRKDGTTRWNGMYFEPQISFDNGSSYYSLGDCGYDGGIMFNGASAIHNYVNSMWFQNSGTQIPSSGTYTVKLKFRCSEYDTNGTAYINTSHAINGRVSATYLANTSNIDKYQHYAHWILKEWIPVS